MTGLMMIPTSSNEKILVVFLGEAAHRTAWLIIAEHANPLRSSSQIRKSGTDNPIILLRGHS